MLLPQIKTDKYTSLELLVMQTDYQAPDIKFLQDRFDSISSSFDKALKDDLEIRELRKIFHEMRMLYTRIIELKQTTGIQSGAFQADQS